MDLRFFDAQIRSVRRSVDDLRNLRYFGTSDVLTTAFDAQKFVVARELLEFWDGLIVAETGRLSRCEIDACVAIGALPAARPTRGYHEIFEGLEARLSKGVGAVGEIGVWESTNVQWELFQQQCQLALDFDLPIVVTPPETMRINMTYQMMRRLDSMGFPRHRTMFNQSCEKTAKTLLEEGFGVGLVVGSFGWDPSQAAQLVSELVSEGGPSRIYVTSGMGDGAADVLGLPKMARELRILEVDDPAIQQVMFGNASQLFTRPLSRRVLTPDL